MKEATENVKALIENILADIDKDSKAARARVRKASLQLEKSLKIYRKVSIEADKK